MSTNIGSVPPKPPSFEKRLPLALALMMLVLLASQYFFKPAPGPKPVSPVNKEQAAKVTNKPSPATVAASPAAVNETGGSRLGTSAEPETAIATLLIKLTFTTRVMQVKN